MTAVQQSCDTHVTVRQSLSPTCSIRYRRRRVEASWAPPRRPSLQRRATAGSSSTERLTKSPNNSTYRALDGLDPTTSGLRHSPAPAALDGLDPMSCGLRRSAAPAPCVAATHDPQLTRSRPTLAAGSRKERTIHQSPNHHHPITQSLNRPITQSPNHPITQSPHHPITLAAGSRRKIRSARTRCCSRVPAACPSRKTPTSTMTTSQGPYSSLLTTSASSAPLS